MRHRVASLIAALCVATLSEASAAASRPQPQPTRVHGRVIAEDPSSITVRIRAATDPAEVVGASVEENGSFAMTVAPGPCRAELVISGEPVAKSPVLEVWPGADFDLGDLDLRRSHVTGRIAGGRSGVRVIARPAVTQNGDDRWSNWRFPSWKHETTTGADGRFDLELVASLYFLTFVGGPEDGSRRLVAVGREPIDLGTVSMGRDFHDDDAPRDARPPATREGSTEMHVRVVDTDASGLQDALVLVRASRYEWSAPVRTARTNESGTVEVSVPPRGSVTVVVPGRATRTVFPEEGATRLEIEMKRRGLAVRGSVRSPLPLWTDLFVAGPGESLSDPDGAFVLATIDADGMFALPPLADGEYRAALHPHPDADLHASRVFSLARPSAISVGLAPAWSGTLTIRDGEIIGGPIELPPASPVAGRVSRGGRPAPDVAVVLFEADWVDGLAGTIELGRLPFPAVLPDEDGRFVLYARDEGERDLLVVPHGRFRPVGRSERVDLRTAEEVKLEVGDSALRIEFAWERAPVDVSLTAADADGWPRGDPVAAMGLVESPHELQSLDPGRYLVRARSGLMQIASPVTLRAGAVSTFELAFVEGVRVRFRTSRPGVVGAVVIDERAERGASRWRASLEFAGSESEIVELPAGKYLVVLIDQEQPPGGDDPHRKVRPQERPDPFADLARRIADGDGVPIVVEPRPEGSAADAVATIPLDD
jgi:hypothetical protein